MKIQRYIAVSLFLLLLASVANAQSKKGKYVCDEPNPQSLCTASQHLSCFRSVLGRHQAGWYERGDGYPGLPKAKGNSLFCVKEGTTVTFQIILEGNRIHRRLRAVVAVRSAGHDHRRSAEAGAGRRPSGQDASSIPSGACYSGATYGMCGSGTAEAIVMK